ncbi:MAG: ParB/RepB/Spo0J family partition protein [Gemmatimonadota bacterium]|nr:MAG: ParB/RepB/Spo0J family partition protein [Gemmatimonadota bacterium]
MTKKVLGKGLQALIPEPYTHLIEDEKQLIQVELARIKPNPYQPREEMDDANLEDLKRSITEKGVLQPLILRQAEDGFELIAGERRYRAAKEARLETVPAIVMDVTSPEEMLELSLVENIQREDLNAIDQAKAYQRLMEEYALTQDQVAQKVGKNRSTVANFLRLLQLPVSVQEKLKTGSLTMGHARALLALEKESDQESLSDKIVHRGLSVRRVEEMVRNIMHDRALSTGRRGPKKPAQIVALEEKLRQFFGTQVRIRQTIDKGKIEIEFYSSEDLDRVIELLLGEG